MKIKLLLITIISLFANSLFANEYHVSKKGNDRNKGSLEHPFYTIARASEYALPGDVITVHEGVYREWVNPLRGGESDEKSNQ